MLLDAGLQRSEGDGEVLRGARPDRLHEPSEAGATLESLPVGDPARCTVVDGLEPHRLGHRGEHRQLGRRDTEREVFVLVPDRELFVDRETGRDDAARAADPGRGRPRLHSVQCAEPLRPRFVIRDLRPHGARRRVDHDRLVDHDRGAVDPFRRVHRMTRHRARLRGSFRTATGPVNTVGTHGHR